MAWNRPNDESAVKRSSERFSKRGSPRALWFRGAIAAVIVVGGAAVWLWLSDAGSREGARDGRDARRPRAKAVATGETPIAPETPVAPEKIEQVKRELNEQVKEFVKKPTGTNNVTWIVKPLDPDDPDRALYVRVTQELATLLAVEPGERMPPFPFKFLADDDLKENGIAGNGDNGNKAFLDSLEKFKIQAKESDDENRLAYKERLIEAQGELLAGIDKGISVDDAIRAAYDFRQRAYEMRSTIVKTLTELHDKDGDTEGTVRQIKDLNNKLAEEGIKKISVDEVIEDYEEKEGADNEANE